MARHYKDWLTAYVEYASYAEAPPRMHFWSAVSAVAGVLRRRVWIDQVYFKWYPNHYIILVAPPGIVSKSTTAAIAMNLLRQVKGVSFGPDVVTWPALVTAFASSSEMFEYNGEMLTQCALTLESSEFGNLVNPQDREMIDLLVTLWDSKQGAFKKVTKGSGNDTVENPWINMIACTTPAWIAGNFPDYMIGGGFTSRCLFIYADKKEKLTAYPFMTVPADQAETAAKLAEDLSHIAEVAVGPYTLTPDAIEYGELWYANHYEKFPEHLNDDRFGGYLARKQTHLHKLAMVLAASQRDEMWITGEDLALANTMITDLEIDMPRVFHKIGRTENSLQTEKLAEFINMQTGEIPYAVAYRHVHRHFPLARDFAEAITGLHRAGLIRLEERPNVGVIVHPVKLDPGAIDP